MITLKLLEENNIKAQDIEDLFEGMLNDTHEVINIAGLTYSAGYALKTIDPVVFGQGALDYVDGLLNDGQLVEIEGEYFWAHDVEDLELEGDE